MCAGPQYGMYSASQAISPSPINCYFCQIILKTPTLSRPFSDAFCGPVLGHLGVEGGVVQGPLVLPAGGLNKRGQVGLWDVQP